MRKKNGAAATTIVAFAAASSFPDHNYLDGSPSALQNTALFQFRAELHRSGTPLGANGRARASATMLNPRITDERASATILATLHRFCVRLGWFCKETGRERVLNSEAPSTFQKLVAEMVDEAMQPVDRLPPSIGESLDCCCKEMVLILTGFAVKIIESADFSRDDALPASAIRSFLAGAHEIAQRCQQDVNGFSDKWFGQRANEMVGTYVE
ncbi:MAG TPA: hypothetical protein VHR66_10165 [Gemmataceae bacterium]|nr:hypothetical protein [Gemmataceae bacterium]